MRHTMILEIERKARKPKHSLNFYFYDHDIDFLLKPALNTIVLPLSIFILQDSFGKSIFEQKKQLLAKLLP